MLPDTTVSVFSPMPISTGFLPSAARSLVPAPELGDHRDRGADGAVLIVIVRQRQAEHRHDGVADELVEHAALLPDALHHDREVLVQEHDRALRAQFLGHRREAADVGEQHGADHALAAQHLFRRRRAAAPRCRDPCSATWWISCAFRCEMSSIMSSVPRFFAGLALSGTLISGSTVRLTDRSIGPAISSASTVMSAFRRSSDVEDALHHPGVGAREQGRGRLLHDLVGRRPGGSVRPPGCR